MGTLARHGPDKIDLTFLLHKNLTKFWKKTGLVTFSYYFPKKFELEKC